MGERPRRGLAEQLEGPLPAGIAALDESHQRDLADALRDARHQQAAALASASEEALGFVPPLLRGAVRKAVGL